MASEALDHLQEACTLAKSVSCIREDAGMPTEEWDSFRKDLVLLLERGTLRAKHWPLASEKGSH